VRIVNARTSQVIQTYAQDLSKTDKDKIDRYSSQEIHYLLTGGIRAALPGIINPVITIISEFTLMVMLCCLLIFTDLFSFFTVTLILGATSVLLYRLLSVRQYRIGQLTGSSAISSVATLQESIHGYRELLVRGTLSKHLQKFSLLETFISSLQTRQVILSVVPRHVLETIVIITLGLVAVIVSSSQSSKESLLVLSVFAATTARILPSLIPLQGAFSELNNNMGLSQKLQKLIADIKTKTASQISTKNLAEVPNVIVLECDQVSYQYPGMDDNAVSEVSLTFSGAGWFAIDGPSGSGKSTLFDLFLGIKQPQAGQIRINGNPSREFLLSNPGVCAYLPQRITTSNASVAENVAFGETKEMIDIDFVEKLLNRVGLGDLVGHSSQGVWTELGELGQRLSGGQLQRLGIARCLYTNPLMILLDESTTGLDYISQQQILDMFLDLSKTKLIVSISHDREITKRAHRVVRLDFGKVLEP
jgi:ATP-binding cassette subfamily C protein